MTTQMLLSSVAILLIVFFVSFDRSSADGSTAAGESDDVSTTTGGSNAPRNTSDGLRCHVNAIDPYLSDKVKRLLKEDRVSLIEYRLRLTNYSADPLCGGDTRVAYRLDKWSRVTTSQGQTLLSLAFNYGVLSMATLTLGTQVLDVHLADDPPGCIGSATETEKTDAIKHLLMRDFDQNSLRPTLVEEHRVCHEVIFANDGYAVFRDQCYFSNPNTKEVEKDADVDNVWLTVLYVLLFIVRYALIFFGPCLFISSVERMSSEQIPYAVKLKEKLFKTVFFSKEKPRSSAEEPKHKKVVDLSNQKGFPKLQEKIKANMLLVGKPVDVKFSQYDITVNYRRLQMENTVDVGLLQSLYSAIFQCNIRSVGPFQECCREDMCFAFPCTDRKLPWIKFWRKVAKASMVVLVPVPYYIRLIVYYLCEHEEIMSRKAFIARAGLRERYETTSSLMHYLTPTHPFFICIYVVYFVTAIVIAVLPKKKREGRLLKIVVGSFRDLRTLSWTETLSMVTSNVIWPLKRFGLLGCAVGLVYWPIALPVTLVVAGVYLVPTVYLTVRMAFYSRSAIFERMRRRKRNKPYQVNTRTDKDMHRFETAALLDRPTTKGGRGGGGGGGGGGVLGEKETTVDQENDFALDDIDNVNNRSPLEAIKDNISLASSIILYQTRSWRRTLSYAAIAALCIATLYGTVIVLSEVIGCLVEVVVFTIMGVIVNAAVLLKYVMLVLMIFVYCCDCFNNVHKKYIKLNKALFAEIKGRIKDLSDITSLPSALQENCGFKAQELNEQGKHESPDDVVDRPRNHWAINDLVLFVDSEDMPRIPKMLFDQVCQIRVAGVPGPVYRGLIEAMEQLLKIIVFIVFVFIVVLTFGSVYKVSATNQMLATMVGGFLPMMLKTFMAPPSPDIEIGTVSFKSKLDEVIKNFVQSWPIYDLPFDLVTDADLAAKKEKDANASSSSPPPSSSAADVTSNPLLSSNPQAAFVVTMGTTGDGDDSNDVIIPLMNLLPHATESNNNASSSARDNGCQATLLSTSVGEKTTRFADPLTSEEGGGGQRTDVDILIYLPDKYEDTWLDEWSDITSTNR